MVHPHFSMCWYWWGNDGPFLHILIDSRVYGNIYISERAKLRDSPIYHYSKFRRVLVTRLLVTRVLCWSAHFPCTLQVHSYVSPRCAYKHNKQKTLGFPDTTLIFQHRKRLLQYCTGICFGAFKRFNILEFFCGPLNRPYFRHKHNNSVARGPRWFECARA